MMPSLNDYQTIFNHAGDAIFIHDLNSSHIVDVNQATEVLTGFAKPQLRQMTVADISTKWHILAYKML